MNVYWYGTKAKRNGDRLELYFYDNTTYTFSPLERSEWIKLKSIRQNFSTGFLNQPFRVGSGVIIQTKDEFFAFYIREPHSYVYPLKLQGFGNILHYELPISVNAMNAFVSEVFIWKDRSPIKVKFGNYWNDRFEENFKNILLNVKRLPIKDINEIVSNKPIEVKADKINYKTDNFLTINMYYNDKLFDQSKGYVTYDKNTNSIEIMYIYKIPFEVNEVKMISIEALSNPIVFMSKEVLSSIRKDYFTPSTEFITNLIHNI